LPCADGHVEPWREELNRNLFAGSDFEWLKEEPSDAAVFKHFLDLLLKVAVPPTQVYPCLGDDPGRVHQEQSCKTSAGANLHPEQRAESQAKSGSSFYPATRRRAAPARGLTREAPEPAAGLGRHAETQPAEPGDVSHALTLQGAQQVLAVLRGHKLIENRAWKIPSGWYAIHCGAQHINEERAARLRQVWPEAPPEESLPHSAIMGVFFVHSQRAPSECLPGYVWARGPICHLVSKAIELRTPIRCSGDKGLWRLQNWQCAQIQEQVKNATVVHHDLSIAIGIR